MGDRGRAVGAGHRGGLGARAGAVRGRAAQVADRIPAPWRFAVTVFLGTKIVLTLVGVLALTAFDHLSLTPPADGWTMRDQQRAISPHRWVSLWFAWDSFLYEKLAQVPLDRPWQEFGFPLLYPFLGRALAPLLAGHTAMALLLVANAAFLLMLYYAHRLGEQLLGDPGTRRFVRYLVLLPTAFLFQAALTESLFLCLTLAAFHYAERRRWLVVGVLGFFLALSRSVGFFVVVPLALVLLRQHDYRFGRRVLWGCVRTGWPLLLVPAGWLAFMAFCRWQGGDWFAYQHAQKRGWGVSVQNPLGVLWHGLAGGSVPDALRVGAAVLALVVVVAGVRRIGLPYVVYGVIMVLVPLSMGPPVYKSLLRYLLAAFPVALVLAGWTWRARVGGWLTTGLVLLQGALFVIWLAYWNHFII
ncbi:hypothetical protein ACFY2R_24415 [Micromonospora olivasterospora]|uniref:hypothetical protein n=1 Tax=Micromonospora olivasterospora TaxID=1880 RepID=UPI0031DCDBDE